MMNYTHDDILIVGDSYCHFRWGLREGNYDWPIVFSNLLTGSYNAPRGIGGPGCSWWFTRKILISELSIRIPKILVICHTEPNRIVNDYNLGINHGAAFGDWDLGINSFTNIKINQDDIKNAAREYYKYLNSTEYNAWCCKEWYLELEGHLLNLKIPCVIHLNCFFHHTFNYGTTATDILASNGRIGDYHNHFNSYDNKKIGYNLYQAVLNYNKEDRIKNLNLFKELE